MRRAATLTLCAVLAGCSASSEQAGSCPGPRAGWAVRSEGLPHMAVFNRVSVAGTGTLKWNGAAISRERLREYLGIVREMEPRPFTILQPDRNVDCAFLQAVRDDMAGALPCDQGDCGEGRGRWGYGTGPRRLDPAGESDLANAIAELEAAADAAAAEAPQP